jgi:glycosyltransferase involved in cell wall biosynthesis
VKISYVVPRYGTEIRGGAETGARMLAEHLVADRGWDVEVLTTCAVDAITWFDEFPPGTSDINGVTVRRMESEAGRDDSFHPLWGSLRAAPERAGSEDMQRLIDLQGPRSPALLHAVESSDADVIVFYPYLYYPTVRGLPLVRERAVMHPAAHEEPFLHLPVFDELFASCRGFVFQTRSERALVERRFDVASARQVLMGLGVEEPDAEEAGADPATARTRFGLGDDPFLLCIGRVDEEKGTGVLWRWFRAYKDFHPGALRLVFVGQVVDAPEPAHDVIVTGMIEETAKWALLRGARAVVAPSPHEAFSITAIEALSAGAPIVVNGLCGPTVEHCKVSGAGMWFDDFADFEAVLVRITGDDALHATMAGNGRRYVDANFRWPVILERYCGFLEAFAAGKGVP